MKLCKSYYHLISGVAALGFVIAALTVKATLFVTNPKVGNDIGLEPQRILHP
jgi:hypothetical protein